jgi:release factor glutamine methyltransferase
VSINQTLHDAGKAIRAVSDTPLLDAEILLSAVLARPRSYLRAHGAGELTENEAQQFQALVARRLQREPVAYITGCKEFWSLALQVNHGTLIPRPETELLVETALRLFPGAQQCVRAADLGTGSGAIALALAAERAHWEIHAVDNSEIALKTANDNAQRLGLAHVSFHCGHWFNALPVNNLDLVISNPPYLAANEWPEYGANLAFEPRAALVSGEDGLQAIREICASVSAKVRPGGYVLLEHGFAQGASVRELLASAGCGEVQSLTDLAGCERVSLGRIL